MKMTPIMTWTLWGVVLCISACAPEQSTVSQPLTAQGEVAAPTPDALPQKLATPLPVVEVITPDATALAAHPLSSVPGALPESQRERLASSPLPVLMPGAMTDPQLAHGAVTTGSNWYALSSTHDGVTLYMQGSRTTVEHGQIAIDEAGETLTQKPYVISRNHQVITISFTRFGLGYHLDVECAKPQSDVRCTQDDYVLSLYESMALVATPAQGGAQ